MIPAFGEAGPVGICTGEFMSGTAVSFGTLDWAIVALYFVVNTAICIWCALQKEKDTADYFLASRNAGWFLIGSSIFASNIGAEHLIGLAGSGAESGMAFAHWERSEERRVGREGMART